MAEEVKILTNAWGKILPFLIQSYEKEDQGWKGLKRALSMKPAEVIEEVERAKLCGRGGAGFPTAKKWQLTAYYSSEKFFICNLDESEPGVWKDRTLAEKNPFRIIEGILIASYAIGAEKAFIYLNGNFKQAEFLLKKAREVAYQKNFLGKNILNSNFNLDLDIFVGAGAYICGEESALIESIEGKRGEPRSKPPFVCSCGLKGKPTIVNNAETVANLPWILREGGEKFSQIGHPDFPGTKLFCIDGKVNFSEIFEMPTGVSIRKLIFEAAGGMRKGSNFCCAQVGGSSGRVITPAFLDEIPSYQKEAFLPMGSGSVLVFSESDNLWSILLSWIRFFQRESCGKCVPCREGTFRLLNILERVSKEGFQGDDKEDIEKLIFTLDRTTFCPLGKFSVVGLKDIIRYKLIPLLGTINLSE